MGLQLDLKECMRSEWLGQGCGSQTILRGVGRSEKGNNREENSLAETVVVFHRYVTDQRGPQRLRVLNTQQSKC